ncbi:MAG: DEAD/DEAH box helicase, partial [Desulfobacteraceae bacterium]|nr:DEAD/DEAH box helicase [Desulfobacteraceae bacterium]
MLKHFFSILHNIFKINKTPQDQAPSSPTTGEKKELPSDKSQAPRPRQRKKRKKWSVADFDVPAIEGKIRFHDFDLPPALMHAIADLKFEYCTEIQAKLLSYTLKGKDAMAKAQTGTGKSASFIVTLITQFKKKPLKNPNGFPRALIIAPTRELVIQIEKDFKALAKYSHLRILSIFGGTGYKKQQMMLKERPCDVIVATPGRLIDFAAKKLIHLKKVEFLVIDEADRMLDMGFIPDVRKIIRQTPHKQKRQTMFFSATLTDEVLRLSDSWTKDDTITIEINPEQAAAQTIDQIIYLTAEQDKFKNIYNLIEDEKLYRVIIFVNRKDTARKLDAQFHRYAKSCSVLSGDISQNKRFSVLNDFKKGKIKILVATDVAARGLHIEDISHVINYDLPQEPEHYIHRIGRTGRAGAKGTSISFAD